MAPVAGSPPAVDIEESGPHTRAELARPERQGAPLMKDKHLSERTPDGEANSSPDSWGWTGNSRVCTYWGVCHS